MKPKVSEYRDRFQEYFGVTFANAAPQCHLGHPLMPTRIVAIKLPSDIPICTDCRDNICNKEGCAVCPRCSPMFILCKDCYFNDL